MRFYLFDKIVEFEKDRSCAGVKCVSISEDFFDCHYSRCPIMPESLLLEAIGQVGSWATAASIDFEALSVLLSFKNFRSWRQVRPGDVLRLEVDILSNNDFGSMVTGRARVEDNVVADVENIVFWSYRYDGFAKEYEKGFNTYRAGDSSIKDNAWYNAI